MTTATGAERLDQWIRRSKLTQAEAAEFIGIDATQLSQILGGKRRPGLDNAVKIANKTGIAESTWTATEDGFESGASLTTPRKARSGKT